MTLRQWEVSVVLVVVVGGGALAVALRTRRTPPTVAAAVTEAAPAHIAYHGEQGKTALALLKAHATVITATDSNLGEFVTAINGTAGGTAGKYWVWYLNGQPTIQRADSYRTNDRDQIEWKLE